MPLTASDVRSTDFRVVLRGYSVEEVDIFLDRVEQELARREAEPPPQDRSGIPPDPAAVPLPALIVAAGPQVGEDGAAGQGLRLLQLAEATADRLLGEARREADELRAAGRREAEELTSAAQAEAQALRGELQAKHERDVAELEARRRDLTAAVQELQRAEAAHRERMVTLLTDQLRVVQPGRLRAVT